MSLTPEAVLAYISEHGPAVPNHIRQALAAKDNFVVGAVLSELVQSGKLALTSLTYGTSKFYYDPKRPELLEPLGTHLGEKDRRAFELLQKERVVRHSELTPLNRVAVAAIADFSRVLPVETPTGMEKFWRYYLVSEDDAFDEIVRRWFPSHAAAPGAPLPQKQAPQMEEAPVVAPTLSAPSAPAATVESTRTESPVRTESSSVATVAAPQPSEGKTAPKKKSPAAKQRAKAKRPSAPAKKSQSPAAASEFSQTIAEYFSVRNIRLDENLGSNKSELTALVRVPSAIGEMHYYCKAKTKKITTDGDLASAFLEAQQRGLPLLYLAAGSLSKKAQETLPTLKGAVVAKPFSDMNAEAEH